MWPCEGIGNNSTASPNNSTNSNIASKSSGSGVLQDQNQTTPTWADRVRSGIARGGGAGACVGNSPLGSSRPSPSSNGGTNKPQAVHSANGEVKSERKSSSSDRANFNASAVASGGVDHVLQTDSHQLEKQEQDTSQGERSEERGEKGEDGDGEGGGWETVNNSRNQSRINSATTVYRHDRGGTTQSISAGNIDCSSSNDEEHANEETSKDGQPSSSSSSPSSESSPQRNEVTCELSASPPSQVDFLTSRSDDLSLANTDDSDSDQGLSIEDIASGVAGTQLLLDDDEEEEEEEGEGEEQGVEPKDKSADLGGTSTLSQGLSQASDKVDRYACSTCTYL